MLLSTSTPVFAAGTIAGTDIENVASATFDTAGGPVTITTNTVTIKVDELLDVAVVNTDPGDVITNPGKTGSVQSFRITNTGNGDEAFALNVDVASGGDDFDPTLQHIVIDGNNNGLYDAGVDVVYVAGANDPVIAPDQSQTVFVVTSTPLSTANGARASVGMTATAVTGAGIAGTSFAGQGQGGGNAVIGSSTAQAAANGFLVVQSASLALVKSASIADPFGGQRAVPGALVTYRLVATVSGDGALNNLVITDPIPSGSAYQAGSLTLQKSASAAVALTDAADADPGTFNGTRVAVAAGNVPAGETRTVTFKVVIQ
ncbi:MAG: hypothetical protein ACK4S7_03820 [Sphingorhabdus sp.]